MFRFLVDTVVYIVWFLFLQHNYTNLTNFRFAFTLLGCIIVPLFLYSLLFWSLFIFFFFFDLLHFTRLFFICYYFSILCRSFYFWHDSFACLFCHLSYRLVFHGTWMLTFFPSIFRDLLLQVCFCGSKIHSFVSKMGSLSYLLFFLVLVWILRWIWRLILNSFLFPFCFTFGFPL